MQAMEQPSLARKITVREFEKMLDANVFRPGERLELLFGTIYRKADVGRAMTPQSEQHARSVDLTQEALRRAFGGKFTVRAQGPLWLASSSRPEPDLSVIAGDPREWAVGVYASAVLVVEVAASSLAQDRGVKKELYAAAKIEDYWIVNLVDSVLEVYRRPVRAGRQWTYESALVVPRLSGIAPLATPRRKVRVKDLLP